MPQQTTLAPQQTTTPAQTMANASAQSVPSVVSYPSVQNMTYLPGPMSVEQATTVNKQITPVVAPVKTVTSPPSPIVGITSTEAGNQRVDVTNTAVQKLISQGLTPEAAIGTEVERLNREASKKVRDVITSTPARDQAQIDLATLAGLTTAQPETISAEQQAAYQRAHGDEAGAKQTEAQAAAARAISSAGATSVLGLSPENQSMYDTWVTQLDAQDKKLYDAIEAQRATIGQQNQAAITDIQNAFAKQKEDMKRLNASRIKGQEILGNLSGRQRYAPTEQMNIMTQEQTEGMDRLQQLSNAEQSFINQAKQAAAAEDWKLLYESLNAQRAATKDKISLVQTMWEKTRSDEDRAIKRSQQERQVKKDALEDLSLFATTGRTLTPVQATEYDKVLGYGTGFTSDYISASQKQVTAKSTQDYVESMGKIYDMVSKAPLGEVIAMPDGSKLYGRKGAENVIEITETKGNDQYKVFMRINPQTLKPEVLGSPMYIGTKEEAKPSSYKEWELSGGLSGTGKTYGEWLVSKSPETMDLTDKELAALDRTKEKKALDKLADLKIALGNYKTLVDTFGTELYGGNAARIDSAYATAKVLWKEAANLGALTGPDVTLLEEALKPASGLKGKVSLGLYGLEGIKSSIDDAISATDKSAKRNLDLLIRRNARYKTSEYVKALGEPFGIKGVKKYNSSVDLNDRGTAQDIELFRSLADDPVLNSLPEDEVFDIFNQYLEQRDFNSPLSMGENGSLEGFKRSIVTQESGGDYGAVGAQTKYGNALGKYQIIPQFHFSKIGLADTSKDRQKFLNSPELQDKLFTLIIDDLNKKYGGDYSKMAAAYYGGGGAVQKIGTKAADVPQGKHPSINQYIQSVLSRIS